MTSQAGKQMIATYTLPNISRNKGNQSMKFGQFIEYKMRNFSGTILQKMRQGD